MRLSELIERLQDIQSDIERLAEESDPDVYLAIQPEWAFQYTISGIVFVESLNKVYIGEGSQDGYLPHEAHEEGVFDS